MIYQQDFADASIFKPKSFKILPKVNHFQIAISRQQMKVTTTLTCR